MSEYCNPNGTALSWKEIKDAVESADVQDTDTIEFFDLGTYASSIYVKRDESKGRFTVQE
jgi:hypothetical protein